MLEFVLSRDGFMDVFYEPLPTTAFAVFMGCRNHKARAVVALSVIDLSVLLLALIQERMHHASEVDVAVSSSDCEICARDLNAEPIPMQAGV